MNILFIGGDGINPNANTVCVNNMAREMVSQGHHVWILAKGDEYVKDAGNIDGAELWQMPENYYGKLVERVTNNPSFLMRLWFDIFALLRHFVIFFTYPNAAPGRAKNVSKKAKQIVRDNNIQLVVAIFNRFENIYSGLQIKKEYGDKVKVVSYHLDLRTASINPSRLVRNFIYKKGLASIVDENRIVDKMLIPYSGQKDIESLQGLDLSKIVFVGFPVYIKEKVHDVCDVPFENDTINVTYIGSLSRDNRNPQYILSILERASKQLKRNIMVHFWGDAGGMEDMLEKSPVAVYHGMIDNRYVKHVMLMSDFLLNIGNAVAYTMLPSKVFGMFATGKPIINIIAHPLDATLPFFARYNYSLDIKEFENNGDDDRFLASKIDEFLNSSSHMNDNLFNDFMPETICNLIMK